MNRHIQRLAVIFGSAALLTTLTGCGSADEPASSPADVERDSVDSSPTSSQSGPALTPNDLRIDANFGYAEDVAEWLEMGRVSQAFSGTLLGAEVGPAVTEVDETTGDLFVDNTVLLEVKVDEAFIGDAKPGDVVSVVMWAGSGGQVPATSTISVQPSDSGYSVDEFDQAFPPGARVVAMSNPHSIEQLMTGASPTSRSVYPDGLRQQSAYMHGMHPQSLIVETVGPGASPFGVSFDEVLKQLSAATSG